MLTLTSLFISVFESLPRTAYLKMMDVWLMFSLLVPFFEVLLHTVTEMQRTAIKELEGKPKVEAKLRRRLRLLEKTGRIAYPVTYSIFVVCFFFTGLSNV